MHNKKIKFMFNKLSLYAKYFIILIQYNTLHYNIVQSNTTLLLQFFFDKNYYYNLVIPTNSVINGLTIY